MGSEVDRDEFYSFYDMFKRMNGKDLARELKANNDVGDNSSVEYRALETVLNERGGVDKYNLNLTDLKSLDLVEYLDGKKVNILKSSVNYLVGVIKETVGYTKLKGQKGSWNEKQVKSFVQKSYEKGKSLEKKL